MVNVRFEELWDAPHGQPYMIIVTTSAVSDGYGKLVMMQGSAAQARQVYPQLSKMAFKKIKEQFPNFRLNGHNEDYGFLPIIDPPHGIGIFQTKRHWAEAARLETIRCSTQMLCEYVGAHQEVNFRLPFPAGGHRQRGQSLKTIESSINEVLMKLPNNVTVVHWR